jgi:uncharacterized protein (TIGR02246 family)
MQDEAALRQIVEDIVSAWNRADGQAFASVFAEDAEFRNVYGHKAQGRQAIAQGQQYLFDNVMPGSTIDIDISTIRFIRPDIAYVETESRLQHENNPFPVAIAASIAVKENGAWKIITINNAGILPDAPGG